MRVWHVLLAEGVWNVMSPVLLALALRMVGFNSEGTWFMQEITMSPITTVGMLWMSRQMVHSAIFFMGLVHILFRIIMVYKDYMIILLPLLDFIMQIWSQGQLKSLLAAIWRQLTSRSLQMMDQGEQFETSRVDEQQLMSQQTNQEHKAESSLLDDEQNKDQGEISRVDEQQQLMSQQTNQEHKAESSLLDDEQNKDQGEISRVDEQQFTSLMRTQRMEQQEQTEITRDGEQQLTNMTGQQIMNQDDKAEISDVDEQQLASTTSKQTMDQDKQIEILEVDEEQVTMMSAQKQGLAIRELSVDEVFKLFEVHRKLAMTILFLQVDHGLRKDSQHGTLVQMGMIGVSLLALYTYLCSGMLSSMLSHSQFAGTENYIISASVVITAYGKLLLINMSYIKIVVVPIALLIFIAALWNKLRFKSGLLKMQSRCCIQEVKKKIEQLILITALPYFALHFEAMFASSLALSHFLWFLSSSLGALAVMIASLPVAASPGGAQVLQLLHRTSITVLTITVHTKAAEWAREDMALVFTPELVTVLVWFAIPFRLGAVSSLSIHPGISRKSVVAVIFVVLGYTTSPAYQDEGRTRALRACSFSGCLTYFSMCMLRQWPGSKPASQVPLRLLSFFAKNCFIAAAVLAVMSARHGDFINYMLVDVGRAILSSVCLYMFLLLGPAGNNRRFLRCLDPIVAGGRRLIHLSQRLHSCLTIYMNHWQKLYARWFGETSLDQSSGKYKKE